MTSVKKNDFIEIEFAGRIKDGGEVFDTNIKSVIEKSNLKVEAKPLIISVGNKMTIEGLDSDFENKEIGKEYHLELTPEKSFGKRVPSMIRMIPLKYFLEQKIMPERGMQLNLDGMIAKVISVSGGRILVDFNNPLAGRAVEYDYTIKRIIESQEEKINALQEFFFRKKFEFSIKDNTVTFKVDKGLEKFIEMMGKPFDDILGLKVATESIETKADK